MKKQTKETVQEVIDYARQNEMDMEIVSGEGENGTVEEYDGKPSVAAIMRRLSRERCGGDRWALIQAEDGYRG